MNSALVQFAIFSDGFLGRDIRLFVTAILMINSSRKREGGQNRESFGVVSTPQFMPMRNLLPGFRPLARH
jgi:hypothetical protein